MKSDKMPFRPLTAAAPALALLLSSCSLEIPSAQDAERVGVSFVAAEPDGGKASAVTGHGSDVNSLDVLVFRSSNGALDCRARSLSGEASLSVTKGVAVDYHVIANAPEGAFDGVTTESGFLAARTLLQHNTAEGLVMHGSGTKTFDSSTTTPMEVALSRYACRVTLDRIVPAFKTDEPREVRYRGAFLLNVCGSEPWSGTASLGSEKYNWHSKDVSLAAPVREFLVSDADSVIAGASAFVHRDTFHCLPNPTATGTDVTRLVLAFSVGGYMDYYPIDIPAMESGRWYRVRNVTLNGPGSDDPDEPVNRSDVTFTVEVTPWGDEVTAGDVTFE